MAVKLKLPFLIKGEYHRFSQAGNFKDTYGIHAIMEGHDLDTHHSSRIHLFF